MNLNEFKTKYLKLGKVEYHSYGTGALNQCVDLANAYIKEVLGLTPIIGTNACDFDKKFNTSEFKFIKNTPKGVPSEGDIVVWNNKVGGGAGHVAIALKDSSDKILKTLDQNWSKKEAITEEIHNYNNVLGWLTPIVKITNTTQPTITACTNEDIDTKTETTFKLKDIKRYNKHWTYGDLIEDWVELTGELDKQKVHFDNETSTLIEKNKLLEEKLNGVTSDLNGRINYITQLESKVKEQEAIIGNKATSAKNEINSKDVVKWLKNTGWYAVLPLVITYLTVLQTNIPKEYAVIAVPLIATGIDFIKKLLADNKQ